MSGERPLESGPRVPPSGSSPTDHPRRAPVYTPPDGNRYPAATERPDTELVSVAAVACEGVIGRGGSLDTTYVTGVDAALDALGARDADRAFVLGGVIYEAFQPRVTRMVLSRIPGRYGGDVTVPDWNRDVWTLRARTAFDEFTLERWERREEGAVVTPRDNAPRLANAHEQPER